jgi:hypothetical protein
MHTLTALWNCDIEVQGIRVGIDSVSNYQAELLALQHLIRVCKEKQVQMDVQGIDQLTFMDTSGAIILTAEITCPEMFTCSLDQDRNLLTELITRTNRYDGEELWFVRDDDSLVIATQSYILNELLPQRREAILRLMDKKIAA